MQQEADRVERAVQRVLDAQFPLEPLHTRLVAVAE